jgi:hypothetical protein
MRDRRIFLILVLVILFAFLVVIWYFFGAKKNSNPGIDLPSNPFGDTTSVPPRGEFIKTTNQTGGSVETERIPASERVLTEIWDKPVAGYTFITRDIMIEPTSTPALATTTPKKLPKPFKKTVEYLMFVDRITGNIYGYSKDSSTPFQISNTTVAGVYDAYIVQNGTRVFMRCFDTGSGVIKTVSAAIPYFIEGSDPHQLSDIKTLPDNVTSFAISESSNAYSYLVPNYYGSSIYSVNQKGAVTTVSSPLREWTITYGGETPYMTNKPTAYLEGSTYSLPNKTYIVGGKTGLMTLANTTGGSILASMWSASGLATFLVNKKTAETQILDIRTLAPKCTWADAARLICAVPTSISKGGEDLPDDWFQGTVSFSDNLYSIDSNDGSVFSLFNLSQELGQPFDATHLQANKGASLLVFTNKQGGALWMVNLSKINSSF